MADEEMAEEYDSREDTEKHIKRVGEYLTKCIIELVHKAEMHDYDKIHLLSWRFGI